MNEKERKKIRIKYLLLFVPCLFVVLLFFFQDSDFQPILLLTIYFACLGLYIFQVQQNAGISEGKKRMWELSLIFLLPIAALIYWTKYLLSTDSGEHVEK